MSSLYSDIEIDDALKGRIQHAEDIFIRIITQTIECGIFIRQYMSNPGNTVNFSLRVMLLSMFDESYLLPISEMVNIGYGENRFGAF